MRRCPASCTRCPSVRGACFWRRPASWPSLRCPSPPSNAASSGVSRPWDCGCSSDFYSRYYPSSILDDSSDYCIADLAPGDLNSAQFILLGTSKHVMLHLWCTGLTSLGTQIVLAFPLVVDCCKLQKNKKMCHQLRFLKSCITGDT